jgi:hypothetical protein
MVGLLVRRFGKDTKTAVKRIAPVRGRSVYNGGAIGKEI